MAQIRLKRTSAVKSYVSTNTLLPGEMGVAGTTIWYGPKETASDTAVQALSLASHQVANEFTAPISWATAPTEGKHLTNKTYVDEQVEEAIKRATVKINSDKLASNKWTLASNNTHLTIGSATGAAGNANIAFNLSNVAFTDTANTFAAKQTISAGGIEVSGGAVFKSDVNITGNLTVDGTTTTLNTETLTVEDNLIVTNSKGADISATATNSGLAIRTNSNASNNAYGFVYNGGELKIGVGTIDTENKNFTSNSLQSVMTRTGLSTTANQMVYWDYANKTLRALTVASPLSFSGSTLSLGKITVANLGSGLITGNAERGSIVSGGNGAAYNVSNSIATQTQLGVVKVGTNINVTADGTISAIAQEASSNKIPITGWTATSGDETQYGVYKFEVPFGQGGIAYTDINYAVEVVQTISEADDGTGKYIEAPATVVKDNAANKLIIYTEFNDWDGYVIATSGGKLDSSIAGHQIYNRTGTDNGTALTSRANLAFGEGLIAADDDPTGSSVIKLNVIAGTGITITNNKQTTIAAKLATASVAGVVELGSDTVQTIAANGVTAQSGRTYAIQKNSSGQLVVNVPWTNTTYDNRTLIFQDSGTTRATFNTITNSGLEIINFSNAIAATYTGTTLTISDILATGSARGTVIAGTNNGTTSRYNNGILDVDIDCGEWA